MFDPSDLEGIVDSIYERCGYSRDEAKRPSTLARLLYGPKCLQYVRHMRGLGHCGTLHGQPVIGVRAGQSRPRQEDAIGHEMMHLALGTVHGDGDEWVELAADYGAAALQMPRRAF